MINIIKIATFVAAVALLAFYAPVVIFAIAAFLGAGFFTKCKIKQTMDEEGIY